jgi:hypothetical protein
MYWDDHAPPHFHAVYAEDEVVIEIRTLGILRGKMSRRALAGMGAGTPRRTPGGLGIMHTTPVTKEDTASSVVPPIQVKAPWRVKAVEALAGYRLHVRFIDGLEGGVDMGERIRSPRAGVFAVLAGRDVFTQVFLELGAVTWPGKIDLAPDAMYDEIKKNGVWRLK